MIERAILSASRQHFQWQKETLRLCRTSARASVDSSPSASPRLLSTHRGIASWSKSAGSNLRLALWGPRRTTSVFPHYLPVRIGRDHSTGPCQELTNDLCNVCRELDVATIFEHGINEGRSLAAEEAEPGTYVLAAPSREVERIWQEERQTKRTSSLSAEDLNMMNERQRPAIDIGYIDTILDRSPDCVLCGLISVAVVESYPELFEADDDKGVILDTNLDVRFRCFLLTFPADETEDFRLQGTGPSATYIEIQLRTPDGNKLPRGHHLLQDARDAKPGHDEDLPASGGEGNRTCLYNARLLGGAQVDFGLLQRWMHFCEDHHLYPSCTHKPCDVLRSPINFRVIDVHNRTVIDAPSGCRYIALSYVWGASRAKSLNRGDITTPVFSTPMKLLEALPRTIEDAIYLVKQLGESFLWVDSFCIDQYSPTDKSSQVQLMDQIYGNAFATIIAAYGDSADAGLPGVQPDSRHPERQQWQDVNGNRVFVSLPSLSTEMFGNPWYHRGWTYQEGLLSRRCLIFTRSQVYWKCSAELLAESIAEPEDTQRVWLKPAVWHNVFCSPFLIHSSTGDKDVSSEHSVTMYGVTYQDYVALVEQYTSRELSFESDALPAFSGILNALSRNFGSKMVWALPDSIFDLALLWKVETRLRESTGRRPNVPSWSWVSWSGEVTYDREIQEGYATLDTHAFPVNEYWYQSIDLRKLKIIQKLDGDVIEGESEQSNGNEQVSVSNDNIHEENRSTGPLTPFLYFSAESARFTLQRTAAEHPGHFCINPNVSPTTAADEAWEPDIGETVWIDDPWDGQPNPYDDQSEERRPPMERFIGKEWEFIKMSVWDETEALQYEIAEYEKYKELVYNVLMIEWKGDTAFRVGMGHVKASIWDKAGAVRKSIKLG